MIKIVNNKNSQNSITSEGNSRKGISKNAANLN